MGIGALKLRAMGHEVDTYRRKSDGTFVRAFRKRNGDWLVQRDPCSVFVGMNDWYFSREYEVSKPDARSGKKAR
jgi:hypothetical protein